MFYAFSIVNALLVEMFILYEVRCEGLIQYKYFYFQLRSGPFGQNNHTHSVTTESDSYPGRRRTKNIIQWLWIDYIDWKMTTFYETNKSKFNHIIDIVIVAFECMLYNKHSDPSVVK